MTIPYAVQTRKDPVKLQYLTAFMIVSSIYFVLFTGFKLAPGEKTPNNSIRELAAVTMLPIELNAPFKWQRNLIASLELLDPTIMSLPNTKYGFSRVRNLEFERPVEPMPSYEFNIQLQDRTPTNEIIFIKPIEDLLKSLSHLRLTGSDSSLKASSLPLPIEPDVYWTDQEGTILTDLDPMSLDDIITEEIAFTTTGPTVIDLNTRNEFVRVRLVQSCGNPVLDRRAIDHLRRTFAVRYAKTASSAVKDALENRRRMVLSVHWRFVTGIDDDNQINEENHEYHGNWF